MQLTLEGIRNRSAWEKASIELPSYNVSGVYAETVKNPRWVHFGIGNIFRIFLGGIADRLLSDGDMAQGLTCVEAYDYEIADRIYGPYNNLCLNVILNSDGTTAKRVIAPFGEVIKADSSNANQWERLKEVFRSPGLQMISFTITEKGYALTDFTGAYTKSAHIDIENGPDACHGAMAVVTAMLYQRYLAGQLPLALVAMDNCSNNGVRIQEAVETISREWIGRGFIDPGFETYIRNKEKVAFPWTMVDKITPRPSEQVQKLLADDSVENIGPIITDKKTFIAPFGNAEAIQYLVIEDSFPNGRPPFEKAGVYMTDRDTVNKSEKMKVNTCLNPIHTGLCTYDCMLGYDLFADGMSDPELSRLAHRIGYIEGLPVVADPGIISPEKFLDEVINVRMPNPYLGDTPQRIAVDISQMMGIRFGETIRSWCEREGSAKRLVGIPLAIAGWFRYLLAIDDKGSPFSLAPDLMIPELRASLQGIRFGDPDSTGEKLRPILSNERIFGLNLYEAGIGKRIEQIFREEIAGPGAVRSTLKQYLDACEEY